MIISIPVINEYGKETSLFWSFHDIRIKFYKDREFLSDLILTFQEVKIV